MAKYLNIWTYGGHFYSNHYPDKAERSWPKSAEWHSMHQTGTEVNDSHYEKFCGCLLVVSVDSPDLFSAEEVPTHSAPSTGHLLTMTGWFDSIKIWPRFQMGDNCAGAHGLCLDASPLALHRDWIQEKVQICCAPRGWFPWRAGKGLCVSQPCVTITRTQDNELKKKKGSLWLTGL